MSNESENKRIDIEAYTQIFEFDDGITDEQLVAFGLSAISELKRCYERLDAQKRQFSEIFELCSEYIDPRDVSEMTIQQGRILTEIWSMASYAKDEEELPDFTASE